MPAKREVVLAGKAGQVRVKVRELTVSDVRAWINESAGAGYRDPVQATAFDGFGLDELARMVDKDAAELEEFAPSDLSQLVEVAREMNPHFFRLRSALEWAVRARPTHENSTAPSSSSSASMDTPIS
jgi:hypothetical protein